MSPRAAGQIAGAALQATELGEGARAPGVGRQRWVQLEHHQAELALVARRAGDLDQRARLHLSHRQEPGRLLDRRDGGDARLGLVQLRLHLHQLLAEVQGPLLELCVSAQELIHPLVDAVGLMEWIWMAGAHDWSAHLNRCVKVMRPRISRDGPGSGAWPPL